jgi:hypothetical protein
MKAVGEGVGVGSVGDAPRFRQNVGVGAVSSGDDLAAALRQRRAPPRRASAFGLVGIVDVGGPAVGSGG